MITETTCMGCGGCAVICPADAIRIEFNDEGFYQPFINHKICVGCSLCDKVCPMNTTVCLSDNIAGAYSYKSSDREVLLESASGGFAYDAARMMIRRGMTVCNVYYDSKLQKPVHKVWHDEAQLAQTRNSIYLQSYTVDGFKDIVQMDSGIVFGSPCQISALHNILTLKHKRNNFILVDFFCHGIPSYNLWRKYLENLLEENKNLKQPCVQFRSKKNGWGSFTIRFSENGCQSYSDYAQNHDVFYKIFLENMALNRTCYDCPFRAENSVADIRMGDMWGDKYQNDKTGVSGILVFTDNGAALVDDIKHRGNISHELISDVIAGQRNSALPIPECRKRLLSELSGKHSLKQINNTVIFNYKVFRRLKRILHKGV